MTTAQTKFNYATKRAERLMAKALEAKAEAEALGQEWLAEVKAHLEPKAVAPVAEFKQAAE